MRISSEPQKQIKIWLNFQRVKRSYFQMIKSIFLLSALLDPSNWGQSWPIFQKLEISDRNFKGSGGCCLENMPLIFQNVLPIGVTKISKKFFDIWVSPSWPKIRKNWEKIQIFAKIDICFILFHHFGYS